MYEKTNRWRVGGSHGEWEEVRMSTLNCKDSHSPILTTSVPTGPHGDSKLESTGYGYVQGKRNYCIPISLYRNISVL